MSVFLLVAVSAEPFVGAGKIVSVDPNGIVEVEFPRATGRLPVDVGAALLIRDEKYDLREIKPGWTLMVTERTFGARRKGMPQRLRPRLIVCFMPSAPMPEVEGREIRIGVVRRTKPLQIEADEKLYHLAVSASTPVIIRSRAKFPEFKVGKKLWVKGEKARLRSRRRKERRGGVKAKQALLLAPKVSEFSYRTILR